MLRPTFCPLALMFRYIIANKTGISLPICVVGWFFCLIITGMDKVLRQSLSPGSCCLVPSVSGRSESALGISPNFKGAMQGAKSYTLLPDRHVLVPLKFR
ncbi:hypothetical protein JD844_028998 [Phrynosoma platyrhinos]|uniref:Uncharacterized protein n=1 Tax=Phrynosoma platyrhinos TaxID=52577 RepID=A0ABQ7SII5_PHRPL|nr:hypothetical protein JD844_028998 [Phrynosoma platyrhinos]